VGGKVETERSRGGSSFLGTVRLLLGWGYTICSSVIHTAGLLAECEGKNKAGTGPFPERNKKNKHPFLEIFLQTLL